MAGEPKDHWQRVYERAASHELSWYEPVPERSLELILATGVARDAAVLDVGGGASTLVDDLLKKHFSDVTVLSRLGPDARRVQWVEADITTFQPLRRYALWHDRAVLHFLIDPAARARYLDVLGAALAPGGHLVLATRSEER